MNNTKEMRPKLLLQIVFLVAALVVLTAWATHRTQLLLNRTMERTVARMAADFSVMAEERFEQEFEALALAADLLSSADDEEEKARILARLCGEGNGVTVGVLSVEGNVIAGEYLSRWNFMSLPQASRGQNVLDYSRGQGLLFAVPVRNGNHRLHLAAPDLRDTSQRPERVHVVKDASGGPGHVARRH